MEYKRIYNQSDNTAGEELGVKKSIKQYASKWKWFLVGFVLSIIFAILYLRYTTPMYQATGLIRLITLNNNPTPEEAILGELGLVYGGDKLHTDEIQILRSSSLIQEVVKTFNLNVQIFAEGNIKDTERYKDSPLNILLFASDSTLMNFSTYFEITIVSDSEYLFRDHDGVEVKRTFGSKIDFESGYMVISPSDKFNLEYDQNNRFKVLISGIEDVGKSYRDKLSVYSLNDRVNRSNMIGISFVHAVPEKASDFVNGLIDTYNARSIKNKTQIAESTFDLISRRIETISGDLSEIDSAKENFKVGNMLTDVSAEAGVYVQASSVNEIELAKVNTDLNKVNYMIKYLTDNSKDQFEILPADLALQETNIGDIIFQFNELLLERNRILKSSGSNNPVVLQFNDRLIGLYSSLMQSLQSLRSSLLIRQSDLQTQLDNINSKIASVPGQERENRNIQRQQNIKESIYLYLLQKREEAAISMATAYPSAEVIERAKVNDKFPVYPKRSLIYLGSVFFGLLIPFSILFIKNFFDSKIKEVSQLNILRPYLSIIGELPGIKGEKNSISENYQLSEAIRVIRTNIDFLSPKKVPGSKVILVTSSLNGEGKSFVASHLAKIYSYSKKNVLLLGADIRKPNLYEFFDVPNTLGLTDYLNDKCSLSEVIHVVPNNPNLSILHSGAFSSRPAELLMSDMVDDLFRELRKHYEVIIVDTAPTMLVADTMLIGHNADQTVYIVRANYTDKEVLIHIKDIIEHGKLPNISLLLNDVSSSQSQYYGKYGKGYVNSVHDTTSWIKEIYRKIKSNFT